MKTVRRFTLTALSLSALTLVAVGCTTTGATSGETIVHKVSKETHQAKYPRGHSVKNANCHYDEVEGVFLCAFPE